MTVAAVETAGLTKRYGARRSVDGLDLRVTEGTICGLLGPNGAGKTTTLRMLCGLIKPDGGRAACLGYDVVTARSELKWQIAYMTQSFSLYEDLSVRENLEFVARVFGLELPREVDRIIERFDLGPFADQLAGHLSGGWKQRVALAGCLLRSPRLLLLDEPTAGVDPATRRELWDTLNTIVGEGTTVLVSTHYLDEAERCHQIIYMNEGRLLADGTPKHIRGGSPLRSWRITGPELHGLARRMATEPAVQLATLRGDALDLAGADHLGLDALVRQLAESQKSWIAERQPAHLEDVLTDLSLRAAEAGSC